MVGVLRGVLERHLGPVGGAVEHELFVSGRLAQRLDVLDRFLRREGAPRGSDVERALFEELPEALAADRFFERGAAERVRGAGAALVEQQQVARAQRGRDRLGDEFVERQRCLPGTAGERDHGIAAGRGSGELALDAQRDRAREHARCGPAGR